MNKIAISLLCIFFVFANTRFGVAQQHSRDWVAHRVSDDQILGLFEPIFADSLTGYLCYETLRFPEYTGQTKWYRTTDGGASWEKLTFSELDPWDTMFTHLTPDYYVAPTARSFYFVAGHKLVYTLDRGSHWDTIQTNDSATDSLDLGQYFTMFSEQRGVAGGFIHSDPMLPVRIFTTSSGPKGFAPLPGDSVFNSAMLHNIWESGGQMTPSGGDFSSLRYGCFPVQDRNLNNGTGLTTIVTEDSGLTWQKYTTSFTGYENDTLYGDCFFQKGTPNVWEFPHRRRNYQRPESDWGYKQKHANYNISYCYSEDYGKTWKFDTSFFLRHNNIFGVSPGNVWMLLLDSSYNPQIAYQPPAYKIAHTVDYGKTWDIDTVSPYIPDLGHADCRGLFFLDKSHGWISAIVRDHPYDQGGHPYVFKYYPPKTSSVASAAAASELTLYPNPATSVLHVGEAFATSRIFDALGRTYSVEYSSGALDVSSLPAGVYYVSGGKQRTRFVKE